MREFAADPALRGVVRRATDFEEWTGRPLRRVEAPLLGVVMIVSLGPDIVVGGERVGSFAAGLWDRPVETGHDGEQRGYELYLDVLGARRLLGVPMAELANRLVRLEDLFGPRAGELVERLAEAPDARARHALAQAVLARRLTDARPVAPEVAHAFGRLRATFGAARVEALAEEVGWSRRHLASRFREEVGLPPKTVARLVRIERAVALLRAGRPLADVAYTAGYADQPHFNRDFRALVGCAPGAFPFVQDARAAA